MSEHASRRKTPSANTENCVTKEIQERKYSARALVKKHDEEMKGKKIIRIPIFRGWIEKIVKS